jgi:hypothetical protein
MNVVMERIMNNVLPGNHPQRISAHIHVPTDVLPIVTLHKTLSDAFQKGWLSLKCIHTLEQLLTLCGSDWFCEKVVMVRFFKTVLLHHKLSCCFVCLFVFCSFFLFL